ncbi:MAG TPA: hypothetical protein VKM55_06885 [Candidatus Lokiarchaeia archaeon]|nr:hypothetical protein [Candidatus Lokiarchaeia archaeon]
MEEFGYGEAWGYWSFTNDMTQEAINKFQKKPVKHGKSHSTKHVEDMNVAERLELEVTTMSVDQYNQVMEYIEKHAVEYGEEQVGAVIIAKHAGVAIPKQDLDRAINYLQNEKVELENGINMREWNDPAERLKHLEQEVEYLG